MKLERCKRMGGALVLALVLLVSLAAPQRAQAAGERTYTVTANLYVPGELNTQLPGVTAYLTNGNNPLGVDGYEAVAPTTPVSSNATLTVSASGKVTLQVPVRNPVFTLQHISGCSNAAIVSAPKDTREYATQDGSASRTGRITSLTLELHDHSGTYVFTDCKEFPTLLGVDWTVPLTLSVDFTGVDFGSGETASGDTNQGTATAKPAVKVNYDSLKATIATVEKAEKDAVVSKDGSDVEASKSWVTQAAKDTLSSALGKAKASLSAKDQNTVDSANKTLKAALETFQKSEKTGTKGGEEEHLGKTLTPGTYTISANIWFNKADTGLPLNPHLTNSTFPPYNPVPDNATLTVKEDGTSQVEIPIVIQDKVMTLRSIDGLKLLDTKKNDSGAITSITVDLGALSGESTVVTQSCTCDIQMGDLAMSISGLEKDHTWPATFELNLSGVATTDGGTMPEVALELLDASAASEAMAQAGANGEENTEAQVESEQEKDNSGNLAAGVVIVILIVVVAGAAGYYFYQKKHRGKQKER